MGYGIQLAMEEGSKEKAKELAEEAMILFLAAPGSKFGDCECGNCKFSLGSFLEIVLREEIDSKPMSDARELYGKFRSVSDENEVEIQKGNLSALLVWLNKDKERKDLLRCPVCKKILIPDF